MTKTKTKTKTKRQPKTKPCPHCGKPTTRIGPLHVAVDADTDVATKKPAYHCQGCGHVVLSYATVGALLEACVAAMTKPKRFSIALPLPLHALLTKAAADRHVTKNDVIREAVAGEVVGRG